MRGSERARPGKARPAPIPAPDLLPKPLPSSFQRTRPLHACFAAPGQAVRCASAGALPRMGQRLRRLSRRLRALGAPETAGWLGQWSNTAIAEGLVLWWRALCRRGQGVTGKGGTATELCTDGGTRQLLVTNALSARGRTWSAKGSVKGRRKAAATSKGVAGSQAGPLPTAARARARACACARRLTPPPACCRPPAAPAGPAGTRLWWPPSSCRCVCCCARRPRR